MSPPLDHQLVETRLTAAAELVRRSDGGPMRLRRNGNRKKPMGIYFSTKNGDHLPWESRPELKACWWAEVSPDVIAYQTQPHTLKMVAGGRRVTYTPDLQINLAGGGVQVLEIKNRFEEARDPAYSEKLAQAAAVYATLGCNFAVVDSTELEEEPAFSAVTLLQRYRSTAVPLSVRMAIEDLLLAGPVTLMRLSEVLPAGPMGLATLSSLLVKRMLKFDLRLGLTDDALVHLVDKRAVGTPLFNKAG